MKKILSVIEISESDIKILQAKKAQNEILITSCSVQSITSDCDNELADLLKKMIKALPLITDEFIVLIPRRLVVLRHMKIPSDDYQEIQDIIGLQLINSIPYPIEDINYHHDQIDRNSDGNNRILVTIVHKKISNRYCALLKKAGIKNAKISLSSCGVQQWFAYQESQFNISHSQPTVLINLDLNHSEICFCDNKSLYYSRSLPYGIEYLKSGNPKVFVNSIRLIINSYQNKKLGPKVRRMHVLSVSDEVKGIKEYFDDGLRMEVKLLDPLHGISGLKCSEEAISSLEKSSSVTSGLGVLLLNTSCLVDLTPEEIFKERRNRHKGVQLVKCLCLLFFCVLVSVFVQLYNFHKSKTILGSLKENISRLEFQANKAEEKIRLVRSIDREIHQLFSAPDVITQLSQLTPPEISFQTLSLDGNGRMIAQGYARTNAAANELRKRLVRSSRFHNVDLKFLTKRKTAGSSIMDFKIVSQLQEKKDSLQ